MKARKIDWRGVVLPYDDEFKKNARKLWKAHQHKMSECRDVESKRSLEYAKQAVAGDFRTWLANQTGVLTYFSADWAALAASSMSERDFIASLYGVTMLALNSGWMSEDYDCPEVWYRLPEAGAPIPRKYWGKLAVVSSFASNSN